MKHFVQFTSICMHGRAWFLLAQLFITFLVTQTLEFPFLASLSRLDSSWLLHCAERRLQAKRKCESYLALSAQQLVASAPHD
jgi:hypothetical protein